jgi:hypothetical protein
MLMAGLMAVLPSPHAKVCVRLGGALKDYLNFTNNTIHQWVLLTDSFPLAIIPIQIAHATQHHVATESCGHLVQI